LFAENTAAPKWNRQMAGLAWRMHPPESVADLLTRAKDSLLSYKERQESITAMAFINTRVAVRAMLGLSQSKDASIREAAAFWLSFRQSNDWYNLLDWSKLSFNTAYERKLAQMKVIRQIILDEDQSPAERKNAVQRMTADSIGGQLLIGLAAENKLSQLLLPFIEESIFKNPDPAVRVQASNYFKRKGTNKTYSITAILKLPSNANKGKDVFTNSCASCHQFGSAGKSIGPALTDIAKKFGSTELLDAIINPSASIVFGYEPWLINMKDGESIYGFLVSKNKQNVVIKDISGNKHVIDEGKIAGKTKQAQSLMPDPINNGLTEQNLADIAAYLIAGKK
jgi:putative heme-binding domain-containing protein